MVLKKDLKMAKQVVTETRNNGNVEVSISYAFDKDLIGKKEYQEVVIGNITKYWIRVADEIKGVKQTWKDRQEIIANRRKIKAEKKQEVWDNLQAEKRERMTRYQKMIETIGEIIPTDEDCESARSLQSVSNRAQNKKMCKIA